MDNQVQEKYGDILELSRPVSTRHEKMALENRAAQFSPFAALSGHEDAILETARRMERKIELEEDEKAALDQTLGRILQERGNRGAISVTYFEPDLRKAGGTYVTQRGRVKHIDPVQRKLVMENGMEILLDEVWQIEELPHEEMEQ